MKKLILLILAMFALAYNTSNAVVKTLNFDKGKTQFVSDVLSERKEQKNVKKVLDLIESQRVYDSIYEKTIKFMKKNEGYRSEPYRCMASAKTVGYGHVIKSDDSLSFPLSKTEAESLLRKDFNKRIEWIEDDLGMDRLEKPAQVIALAHFVFNVGQGTFKESMLYDRLKKNGELSKMIMSFVHIKTSQGWVKSSHLSKMREYEFNLYKSS